MKKLISTAALAAFTLLLHAQTAVTPELLWKIGRVSDPRLSPDGKTVVFNVRNYDQLFDIFFKTSSL